jgi:hypothetical protein
MARHVADARGAGADRLAIVKDRAGAALRQAAAEFRAVQLEVVRECVEERRGRIGFYVTQNLRGRATGSRRVRAQGRQSSNPPHSVLGTTRPMQATLPSDRSFTSVD